MTLSRGRADRELALRFAASLGIFGASLQYALAASALACAKTQCLPFAATPILRSLASDRKQHPESLAGRPLRFAKSRAHL